MKLRPFSIHRSSSQFSIQVSDIDDGRKPFWKGPQNDLSELNLWNWGHFLLFMMELPEFLGYFWNFSKKIAYFQKMWKLCCTFPTLVTEKPPSGKGLKMTPVNWICGIEVIFCFSCWSTLKFCVIFEIWGQKWSILKKFETFAASFRHWRRKNPLRKGA